MKEKKEIKICAIAKRKKKQLVLGCFREFSVKGERPEEYSNSSEEFYEHNLKHGTSSAIGRIQRQLTLRAIELSLPSLESKALDVGCGSGYSMQVLSELEFAHIRGIDSSKEMVGLSKEKGFDVRVASMEEIPFDNNAFDFLISISALQWISSDLKRLKKTCREFFRVLKKGAICAIQFYPKSSGELKTTAEEFANVGFDVKIVIDNENNARKRKIFLILRK